ncbi:acetate--CoA ligase family protein [Zwartia vadi]|uniref:acetate--CoA ligase family protein n=1 Tax=Zwartia vadi TaxID=3058168 RepID=UPI0025B307E5|nr:acetate--CoA ligase family protein [Zwartia vadi]MDN3987383.1 acetate--CoA ligase family protein [Zwartia vadi]
MDSIEMARQLIAQARTNGRSALDEPTAKRVLKGYGIRAPQSMVVHTEAELDEAFRQFSGPVVLKLISPEVLHKSDFGAVVLGLRDAESIKASMREISKRCRDQGYAIDGFLLEEMVDKGHEIVVGGYRDETFGPVIMFGLGGIFVEVLQDVTFRICPITEADAREMIQDLRGASLLKGARGGINVPDEVIVETLMTIGGEQGLFYTLADSIEELDINPLLATAQGVIALDARIVLAEC